MSVTFFLRHHDITLNLNNRNAADLLAWLGYDLDVLCPDGLVGEVDAAELAARCRRRLWPEPRNSDPELAPMQLAINAVECGRPAGYLRGRTEELLQLAELAGPGVVLFS